MVPYAGFIMPVQYASGIKEEYSAVRKNVGVFDVSHMGEFKFTGSEAEQFLQKITINNVKKLSSGQAQYSAMCLPDGGIIDDLILYKFDDHFFMVVNASNIEKNWAWIKDHCPKNVDIQNVSNDISLIAAQGPKAREVLSSVFPEVDELAFYHASITSFNGSEIILSRTGYTGELGFEIYGGHKAILEIWKILYNSKKVIPCGLAVRDVLRMEMKYCLYGNDIDESTNPLEAGLGWITSFDKEFIGKDNILSSRKTGLGKRLSAIKLTDRGIPRNGYEVLNGDEIIGHVTSGTHSTGLNAGIGLGYLKNGFHKTGTEVKIKIRNKLVSAEVVKPPFINKTSLLF